MQYDVIIIGAGPAGYVAAIRAGQTGLKTLVIDKKYIGGMCLNWGCIPTKALLESAKLYRRIKASGEFGITGIDPEKLGFDWPAAVKRTNAIVKKLTRGIEYLWKKNAVEFLQAEAKIVSPHQVEADNRIFEAKHIIIATGSRPYSEVKLPKAIELEQMLALGELPLKPVIYGQGGTAFELAQFFALLDRNPILIQTGEVLIPDLDASLNSYVDKKLKKEKIAVIPAGETEIKGDSILHQGRELEFDAVVNSGWRKAVLPDSGLQFELENGYLKVDGAYRTSVPGIFAAGDVNGISYLAHAASAQAVQIIDQINGKQPDAEPNRYPLNIYSDPEIAQLGATEQELKNKGVEYRSSEYYLTANGKSLAEGNSEGFIRLLYEPKYSQVLGVQIVAANATDLIAEAGILMELEGTVYDLARAVHAHPTVSEVFMDASQAAELE
jgi:dihydrolipoamide dehydrogenase